MTDSGFVEVPGGRLYHEVEGAGHTLLLMHGGLGSLRMWDGVVPALASRYRVVRFDQRGYGRSETEHVSFSNRADAAAVLDHVGAASCYLVGQSRGGMIALDLTIERPGLVDALILVASGAGGYEAPLPDDVEPPPWAEMERLWEAKEWVPLAELETQVWVDGWGQPRDRIDPELRRQVHDGILETYRAGNEEGVPQPLDPPAVGRLGEVRAPTLVLVGLDDEAGATLSARHVAESVAGARLVEFPETAHMIHLEEPARVTELVLGFLAEVDGSGGARGA